MLIGNFTVYSSPLFLKQVVHQCFQFKLKPATENSTQISTLLYLQGNLFQGIGVGLLIAALCLKVCVLVLYLSLHILLCRIVNIGPLLLQELPGVLTHLQQLREFYDPDTVELMNWIMYVLNTCRIIIYQNAVHSG